MSNNPYKTREGGATVTIFVPYDCHNKCPFCINKEEYSNMTGFDEAKIIQSIHTMDEITPNCDFVFTGGEPFANMESLQRMINEIPNTHRLFINTTFPVFADRTPQDMLDFCERNKDKITCINISRHLVKYVEESDDELIAQIPVPVRVNCVLYKRYPREKLTAYLDRFNKYGIPIQFRFDYTDTTPDNLYDREHDQIYHDLNEFCEYTGLEGCRMRCGFHYKYKDLELTYHKTLPYSTIVEKGDDGVTYDILYDILIKQTGIIHSDWDGKILDVNKYRNVTFEPYDLKWLEVVGDDVRSIDGSEPPKKEAASL